MFDKLWNTLYFGLPQNNDNPIEALRFRVTNNGILLIVLLGIPFLFRALVWQVWPRVIAISVAELLLLTAVYLLRRLQSVTLPIHMAMAGIFAAVLMGIYSNGGIENAVSGWLLVLPLYAGLMGGRGPGTLWALICLFCMALFWLAVSYGFQFPNMTPSEKQFSQDRMQQVMQYLAVVGCMSAYLFQVHEADSQLLQKISRLNDEVIIRKQAEEDAFEASRVKSHFLASMSHELRTPLNSIIGFTHRLIKRKEKDPGTPDREYDALLSIHNNGKHLHHLINELLDLSKIEAGEIQLSITRVNASNLIAVTVNDLNSLIKESGLELTNKLKHELIIEGDEAKLRQIFTNLISNALKFTQQGHIIIDGKMDDKKNRLIISIKDTGIGIEETELKFLFEPYYNIQAKIGKKIESTGLGLAITKQLVDLHHGRIQVKSVLGEGSEFTLTLPMLQTDDKTSN